ncbi:MAG: pentapeptide repeat-containing protein [Bacteroidaceae bacterium]
MENKSNIKENSNGTIEIKNLQGEVLFSNTQEYNSIKATLEKAVSEKVSLEGADLKGISLINANMRGANLRFADLSNTDLRKADFSYSSLKSAKLSYSDLSNADLSNADLSNADLSNTNIKGTDFSKSNLWGTNFHLANSLRKAAISFADLSRAKTDKRYLQISCIGSEKRTTTYCFEDDLILCGCFKGTLNEFKKRVLIIHKENSQYLKEYLGAIAYIKSLK